MQTQNNIFDELKSVYRTGGVVIQLIFVNILVFLGISIIEVLGGLLGQPMEGYMALTVYKIVALPSDLSEFITQPWTLFTSIFTHLGFWHLLMNMLFLYYSGRLFLQSFNNKRLIYTYKCLQHCIENT